MISRRPVETIIASYSIPRVTYLFHQNWRPEELANVESISCSRMNSRCRSQSCDDCVDPGINGLQSPLTQCITQGASFDMESTRPSRWSYSESPGTTAITTGESKVEIRRGADLQVPQQYR